jgi:hypothetical protein
MRKGDIRFMSLKGSKVRILPVHALRCERLRRLEPATRDQPAKSSAVKEAAKGLAKAMMPPKSETRPATSHKIQCFIFLPRNLIARFKAATLLAAGR